MATEKNKPEADMTTGFGHTSRMGGNRFYRKDGSVNVVRRGVNFLDKLSWYHTFLAMKRWHFWMWLCTGYIAFNIIFGFIYFLIGVEHLGRFHNTSALKNFVEAFFFSAQTFTTVGYGRINPEGFWANAVSSLEAFLGLLAFAMASGLFYGRFAKPQAYIYFSDIALISPYKEGNALMFRLVPYKNNHLTDAEIKLTIGLRIKEGDEEKNVFYPLKVEFDKISSLVFNWTVVHPIDEESPLHGYSLNELKEARAELLVMLKAYDEVFANAVVVRTSYSAFEFISGAKFKPMYHSSASGKTTILEVNKLNDFDILV